MTIELSDTKLTRERTFYSAMAYLGDTGGVYGALIVLPCWFMSFFSERLFLNEVSKEIPAGDDSQ